MEKRLNLNFLFILIGFFSILLRIFALENIPGIIGDEAFGYTQIQLFLKGLDHTFITPSGRILSPIYGTMLLISRAADPFWMRFPALLAGSLTAVISYSQFKKFTSNDTAIISALLVATFPVHFLYSRYAWECCLIPMISLFITRFILESKWKKAFLTTFISSAFVHPTLIFFLPPIMLPFYKGMKDKKLLPSFIYQVAISVFLFISVIYYFQSHQLPIYVPTFEGFFKYILGSSDFWSGTIISQHPKNYFSLFINIFFLILIIILSVLCFKKFKQNERLFFLGLATSIIFLFLIRSVIPFIAGNERAVLFSGVPICLYLGSLLSHFKWGKIGAFIISLFYLWIIVFSYFNPILETGGVGIQTHTGPEDPKYSAIKWVLKDANNKSEVIIIAEDWGIYWNSLNYALAKSNSNIKIRQVNDQQGFDLKIAITTPEKLLTFIGQNGYAIGFSKGKIEELIIKLMKNGHMFSRIGFKDYAGKEYIYVWIPEKK